MSVKFVLLINKQGQTRLSQFFEDKTIRERVCLENELIQRCLRRTEQDCNFITYKDYSVIYRRYASLYFIVGTDKSENELLILDFIHILVETLDKLFENVVSYTKCLMFKMQCELDIMFNIEKAYFVLQEMILGGCIYNTNKNSILAPFSLMEKL